LEDIFDIMLIMIFTLKAGKLRVRFPIVSFELHYHNPSGFTMALESAQLLTEMSTRNIYWVHGSRYVELTTLQISFTCCREIWEPRLSGIPRASPGLYKVCFTICTFIDYDLIIS
jgi:hypothetical protein